MQKRPLHLSERPLAIPVPQLARFAEGWLLDGEIRQHSQQTLAMRRLLISKLLWFLEDRKQTECGVLELRQFFAYITNGHGSEGGRWNNPTRTRQVRPKTVKTYHNHLRPFFHWLIQEGIIEVSPMDVIAAPVCRTDQIQPFDERQVTALLHAAKKTLHPKRDHAIVCFLLDTGVRASELCDLRMSSVDMSARKCIVLGKGNKHRAAFFGQQTAKALWHYLKEEEREPSSAVFRSDRGSRAGDPLTRSGLLQLIERLGTVAHIEAVRCSPHTFRHTFAVTFLRNGGNVFTLQQILGHTSLSMTNRYVAVSQGDLEKQHRQFSPVDRLGSR
jgi:site-specific recombinase XerD